jgi:hypothetical protein
MLPVIWFLQRGMHGKALEVGLMYGAISLYACIISALMQTPLQHIILWAIVVAGVCVLQAVLGTESSRFWEQHLHAHGYVKTSTITGARNETDAEWRSVFRTNLGEDDE